MNKGVSYKQFYDILLDLRELFHSYGRVDDSNVKLDEISKLISISYCEAVNGNRFSLENIRNDAKKYFDNENAIALALRKKFEDVSSNSLFLNSDNTNIFGSNPSLNIQPSEDFFAEKLITAVENIDFINLLNNSQFSDFDIINECFGHFVRENFRNNKEDAQYMTPAEIADPIIDIIFNDMINDKYFDSVATKNFRILDPTCGVGTLLVETARKFVKHIKSLSLHNKSDIINKFLSEGVMGQDKVDRMVRLSKINTMLMGGNISNIYMGNSISENSFIDNLSGSIDFIFTNPPFGAEYQIEDIDNSKFSLLNKLYINGKTISSEILMLLKCIDLLKENGYLAIILPDSVFSSKGINAQLREIILSQLTIKGVFELPSVAFAQAGTRTKTSILYLQKRKPIKNYNINMCICNDIGFTVKERMGVPVKISTDNNEMRQIADKYINIKNIYTDVEIINNNPSITSVPKDELIDKILNPSFYNADRLNTISNLNSNCKNGFVFKKLSEIANFVTLTRKSYNIDENTNHISILHVNADCTIDLQEVEKFRPVSKGRICYEGDVLFSKINPRIPRMTVVPKFKNNLVCSNEFEIIKPLDELDRFSLCLMLKTDFVSKQIENLTSGTSSSHSRIKREQLSEIIVPYPESKEAKEKIMAIGEKANIAWNAKYSADLELKEQLDLLNNII